MNFARSFVSLLLVLLLGACQSPLRSDVVTFHQEPLPAGESIKVVAMDPDKAGSLEFRRYAELVNRHLEEIGYSPVPIGSDVPTELIAEIDYAVSQGPTQVRVEDNRPFARYHFYYGRYYDPFYFGLYDPFYTGVYSPWGPDRESVYTVNSFVRQLELNIVKVEPNRERIFEARVESVGPRSELPEVMPYMITAMFTNFPGENGVTKMVSIERDGAAPSDEPAVVGND